MAERTTSTDVIDRETAAERLEDIAAALRNGEDCTVHVGNKDITLSPPETVNYGIGVTEKQRRFRGNRETVTIELDWKPK
jgi:amphi-Trp domain-containing protein